MTGFTVTIYTFHIGLCFTTHILTWLAPAYVHSEYWAMNDFYWLTDSLTCFGKRSFFIKTTRGIWGSNLLPLVVSECDALWRHLEVHNGGSRWRNSSQRLRYGLGNSLRTSQGFHLYWVDVKNIACWGEKVNFSLSDVLNTMISKLVMQQCGLHLLEDMLSATKLEVLEISSIIPHKHSVCYRQKSWTLGLKDISEEQGFQICDIISAGNIIHRQTNIYDAHSRWGFFF